MTPGIVEACGASAVVAAAIQASESEADEKGIGCALLISVGVWTRNSINGDAGAGIFERSGCSIGCTSEERGAGATTDGGPSRFSGAMTESGTVADSSRGDFSPIAGRLGLPLGLGFFTGTITR